MEINGEQLHTLWNFVEYKVFIEHWVFPCLDLCLISLFLGWEEEYSDLGTAGPAPLFTGDVLGLMNRDGHLPFGRVVLECHLQTATFWYQRWFLSVHVTDIKQVLLHNKSNIPLQWLVLFSFIVFPPLHYISQYKYIYITSTCTCSEKKSMKNEIQSRRYIYRQ